MIKTENLTKSLKKNFSQKSKKLENPSFAIWGDYYLTWAPPRLRIQGVTKQTKDKQRAEIPVSNIGWENKMT